MRKLKFCANLTFLFQEQNSILKRYDSARALGFKGVELGFPYEIPVEDLSQKLKQTGMEQVLINSYPGNHFGLTGMIHEEKEFLESLELSLKYADALGCKRIHFMAGKLAGSENSPGVMKTMENRLKGALPELEKRGIVALIEPINNFTVPGYLLSDFDSALSIIKAINSPFLKLQMDIFHLQQIHGNLSQRIAECLPYTGHIQIAQVPKRNEPHMDGEINYSYIFDLLEQQGYEGWIGLEYKSSQTTAEGLQEWLSKLNCQL